MVEATFPVIRAAASTTIVIFLLLEYSLISISGCKFPFNDATSFLFLLSDCQFSLEEAWHLFHLALNLNTRSWFSFYRKSDATLVQSKCSIVHDTRGHILRT